MSKRRYLVAVIVSVGIAIVLFVVRSGRDDAKPAPRELTGLATVEVAAGREAANRFASMAPAPARSGVGKFSAETIQSTEDAFRRMVAVRGLITQDKERGALAQQVLAAESDGAELMRAILLDPAFASSAFGEFQAEARFYAITVLDEIARQGKLDFVVDVASDLAKQLAATSGEINGGRAEDLRGLATVIGQSLGSRGLQDSHSPVLARLGFGSDLAKPVRQLYVEGMFYGVWKAESIEQAMAAVKTL
jgi:cytochrome P450